MSYDNPSVHAVPVRVLHWLSAFLVLLAAGLALARLGVDDGSTEKTLLAWHRSAGVLVLFLVFFRILVRMRHVAPRHPGLNSLHRVMASGTHFLIYLLLFSVPLLGWAYSSAAGKPVQLLGWTLPTLGARDRELAENLQTLHVDVAYVFLGFILLHVGAALWHHFVLKDDVLHAMLPVKK
jgi:cytochrome b561